MKFCQHCATLFSSQINIIKQVKNALEHWKGQLFSLYRALGFVLFEIKNNKQHIGYFLLPTALYSWILRFYLMYTFQKVSLQESRLL